MHRTDCQTASCLAGQTGWQLIIAAVGGCEVSVRCEPPATTTRTSDGASPTASYHGQVMYVDISAALAKVAGA